MFPSFEVSCLYPSSADRNEGERRGATSKHVKKSSNNVKTTFDIFRQFSRRAKGITNRSKLNLGVKMSSLLSTIYVRHQSCEKLASVLDSWTLKPSCNFLRFPAMCPPKTAFFCRKVHFSAGNRTFLQENAFFCRKMHFSVVCFRMNQVYSPFLRGLTSVCALVRPSILSFGKNLFEGRLPQNFDVESFIALDIAEVGHLVHRRNIHPKKIAYQIKKFIWTSISTSVRFLTRVTGKKAKVRANFPKKFV